MKTLVLLIVTICLFYNNITLGQNEIEANLDSAQVYIEKDQPLKGFLFADQALRLLESDTSFNSTFRYNTYIKYLSIVEEVDNRISNPEARKLFYQNEYKFYEKAIGLGSQFYAQEKGLKYIEKCLQLSERNKNVLFLQTLRGFENKEEIPKELLLKEGEYISQIEALTDSIQYYKSQNNTRLDILEKELTDIAFEFHFFQKSLEKQFPLYANKVARKTPVFVNELISKLSDNQAFIEYFYGDEWIYVFAFSTEQYTFQKIAKTAQVRLLIEEYKNALHRDEMKFTKVSHELYKTLFSFSMDFEGIDKLSIVADGAISFIPFEALITQEVKDWNYDFSTLNYLVHQFQINYYQSAAAFLHLEQQDEPIGKAAALGLAPLFTTQIKKRFQSDEIDSSYLRLNALVQSEKLFDYIGKKFKTQILTGEKATLEGFKKYQYAPLIHFATHTLVDDVAPLQSKIALARSDPEDKGYLFLKDLYQMALQAELVVLGSCETGRGQFSRGDGVVSLAYGFDLAGAASTVYSLWAVDETATNELMRHFYDGIAKGLPKDEALHKAKLHYLKGADEITSSPFYWAGFVINGKTTPLQRVKRRSAWGWYWIVIGIVVVVSISWYFYKQYQQVDEETV